MQSCNCNPHRFHRSRWPAGVIQQMKTNLVAGKSFNWKDWSSTLLPKNISKTHKPSYAPGLGLLYIVSPGVLTPLMELSSCCINQETVFTWFGMNLTKNRRQLNIHHCLSLRVQCHEFISSLRNTLLVLESVRLNMMKILNSEVCTDLLLAVFSDICIRVIIRNYESCSLSPTRLQVQN